MSKQVLLPSPNWYLPSIAACSPDGALAYGSRNCLVLVNAVNFPEGLAPNLDFTLVASAQNRRITAVAWSNATLNDDLPKYLLASASDDCTVAIWDPAKPKLIQKHENHEYVVIHLDWTKVGELRLVSADEKGLIVVWNLVRNTTSALKMLASSSRLQPLDMKCSPVDPDIVAVGCKDGLVCLLNIKGVGSIVKRMRGHDKTVTSVSWCPDTNKLASSGNDKKIIIWNNGSCEKSYQISQKSLSGQVKVKPNEKFQENIKQPILFLKPDLVIYGSMHAELHSWNPNVETPSSTLLNADHIRGLFCLANCGDIIWSLAQDRMLIRYDLTTKKSTVFSTLGGFIYCIAPCPFAPGRVAIGVGDETIRIWNMSDTSGTNATTFWQKIKGKVMHLAWNPEKEGELAFCTNEGRVGVINVSNTSKDPLIMPQSLKNFVYKVCWGPAVYAKDAQAPEDKLYLYACDEMAAVVFLDHEKPATALKTIIKASNPFIKEFLKQKDIAWKPDKSLLAVGLDDGSIQLFTAPHLEIVHTLMSHKQMIYYLAWHPNSTAVDDNDQQKQNWLTSLSADQKINVYDLSPLKTEGEVQKWKGVSLPIKPFAELKHGNKVVSVAWSPHVGGKLVSSGYDMSAKVWDVVKGELLACFTEHVGCVLSCCWSTSDPDVIITGSADFTCRTWQISATSPNNVPSLRSALVDIKKESGLVPVPTNPDRIAEKVTTPSGGTGGQQNSTQGNAQSKKPTNNRLSIFPISNASFLKNAIACTLHMLEDKGHDPPGKKALLETYGSGDSSDNHFGFFKSQEEATDLLKKEAAALKRSNNHPSLAHLKLWQGDTKELITNNTNAKKLDDWLVSMAPSVSHKFWLATCSAYAEQLVEEKNVLKAASYYLMCGKETDAISVLCQNNFFKEAIAICHLRLPADDPLLKNTFAAWGNYCQNTGNFEMALQCFIAVGDYESAAIVLNKKKDSKLWQLGAYLAKLANAKDLHLSMSVECLYRSLMDENWETAAELIEALPELEHFKGLLEVHKIVCAKDKEGLDMAKFWNPSESILAELEDSVGEVTKEDYQILTKIFPLNIDSMQPENKKELLVATSKLLLLAVAGKKSSSENWEHYIIIALYFNYRRSLQVVKERQLVQLLQWLGNLDLAQFGKSLETFKAVAYVSCNPADDPDVLSRIEECKSVLFDPESARFAFLSVQIPALKKDVAAALAKNKDCAKLQENLEALEEEFQRLLNARVAFHSPMFLACRLRGLLDELGSRVKDKTKLDQLDAELDEYRASMEANQV